MSSNSLFGKTNSTGAGSLFGTTPSKEGNVASGSIFGGNKEGAVKPLFGSASTGSAPTFGAGSTSAFSSTPAKPAGNTFSFGASNSGDLAKPSFSLGGSLTQETKPANTFSFGAGSSTGTSSTAFGTAASTSSTSTGTSLLGTKPDLASTKTPLFSFGTTAKPEESKPAVAPAFSFGSAPKTQDQKDAPSASFSFGASKSTEKKDTAPAFSFGGIGLTSKPEEKKDSTPSFSFGGAAKINEKPTTSSFSFGNSSTTKPEEKKDATSAFSFGDSKTTEKKESTHSFSLGSTKPTGNGENKPTFSFGTSAASKSEETKVEPKAHGFSFGTASTTIKTGEKKDTKSSGLSFGSKPVELPKESTTQDKEKKTVSFSSSVIDRDEKKEISKKAEPKPISLNNKTLEDLITKWTSQLANSSTSFEAYAVKVNEWDRVLVEGGEKISQLYTDVVNAEQTQGKVDQALLYIERQQDELEIFLDNYEAKAENLLSDVLSSNGQQRDSSVVTNDQKREQAYHTAELLDENLNSLGTNLSSLISEINDVSDSFSKANGLTGSKDAAKTEDDCSLSQIVKLLNSHLDSLKWIQKNSSELKTKLDSFRGTEI